MQTQATVIIPQSAGPKQIGVRSPGADRAAWPCLWLLHGHSDDHTIWTRRTSIERYAEEAGLAVVMPNGHRSFYTAMAHGADYWTFLSEELPRCMRSFFPLAAERSHNAAAGLSMGGYGAFKWALRRPEMFHAAASLSGATDISGRYRQSRGPAAESWSQSTMALVFGDRDPAGSEDDLFALASRRGPETPALLQICGSGDFLHADNLRFRDHALAAGLPLTYEERPGTHEWGFWDREIQRVLAWLRDIGFGQEAPAAPGTSSQSPHHS